MEDKQKICDLLVDVLNETNRASDLWDLRYDEGYEKVVAVFDDCRTMTIDVALCDGLGIMWAVLCAINKSSEDRLKCSR